jgi:hypothetical protein
MRLCYVTKSALGYRDVAYRQKRELQLPSLEGIGTTFLV